MPVDRPDPDRAGTPPPTPALIVWVGAAWRLAVRLLHAGLALDAAIGRAARARWPAIRSDLAALARSGGMRRWGRRAVQAGLTVAILVVGAAVFSGPILRAIAGATIDDATPAHLPRLPESSEVVAGDGTLVGVVERERRRVVALEELPEHVTGMVLAAEDHRFEDHEGYDLAGLLRAALTNARAGEVEQGGSTITQQLAKLNFTGDESSVGRKAEELLYAVALEQELTKDELLERYLNQVYLGNGAHGIGAAAEEYFATTADALSPAQAATLAAIIQRPSSLDPRVDPDRVERRRDAVLARAAEVGVLSTAEASAARAEPLELAPQIPRPRTDPVLDAVRAEVATLEVLGGSPEARIERLETGGLRVETTLDPTLQAVAGETIAETFPEPEGATAAVAAVDPRTGAIRALRSGQEGPGGFDLARQGRRQPGSTFKPFTAVAALERGHDPAEPLVGDGPIELDHGAPEPWEVDNYGGADVGPVDLGTALQHSVNTAFAQLAVAVGVDDVVDVVDRVGIDVEAALGDGDQRGPSVALGGVAHGVSPLELATGYASFATGGHVVEPHLVARILDADGDVLHEASPDGDHAIDPAVAGTVRSMLEAAMHQGTGRAAAVDAPSFGKTGTSQDGADAWFVGSTPELATAVWIGHPEGRVPMPGATGGRLAAPIWQTVTAAWVDAHGSGEWPSSPPLADGPGLSLPEPEPATGR